VPDIPLFGEKPFREALFFYFRCPKYAVVGSKVIAGRNEFAPAVT
jgi:hypothetical protein